NVEPTPYHGYSSGIGLSLTRNLIELLQGTIAIESRPEEGTKVLISLPYEAAKMENSVSVKVEEIPQKENYAEIPEIEREKTPFENNKPTLLIVEDNPDVQTYLNKELSKE